MGANKTDYSDSLRKENGNSKNCNGHLSKRQTKLYLEWQKRSAEAYDRGQRDFKCPECGGWFWRQRVRGYDKEKAEKDQPEGRC